MQPTPDQPFSPDMVRWRSRRGMLELDFFLTPFAATAYAALPEDQQRQYQKLLCCEDTELYQWLLGKQPAADGLQDIVDQVRAHSAATAR